MPLPEIVEGLVELTLCTSERTVTFPASACGLPMMALLLTSPKMPLSASPLPTCVKLVVAVVSSATRPLALKV